MLPRSDSHTLGWLISTWMPLSFSVEVSCVGSNEEVSVVVKDTL
jgi:hypothetical protein